MARGFRPTEDMALHRVSKANRVRHQRAHDGKPRERSIAGILDAFLSGAAISNAERRALVNRGLIERGR